METNNDFREALMRAWVGGWYEGLRMGDSGGRPRNDDGKIKAADDIARQFPALAAAPALVNASAAVCRNWESPLLADYVRQLQVVLDEIEKGG